MSVDVEDPPEVVASPEDIVRSSGGVKIGVCAGSWSKQPGLDPDAAGFIATYVASPVTVTAEVFAPRS